MLVFFPYRTDAPVYHLPVATVGLIAVNLAVFVLTLKATPETFEKYALVYGKGLHPVQWVTSNFLHAGLIHLAGNMVFLWTFGLVVEGKLGPVVFLPLYLGIGFVQCGVEQFVLSNNATGGSVGASAILYGLMVMAMLWAPRNEVGVMGFIAFRGFDLEVPISSFAGLLLVWELAMIPLAGMAPSSAALHMSGAVIGFAVGAAMLKLRWVDCEGWDLFTLMNGGRPGEREEPVKRRKKKRKQPRPADE